MPPAGMTDKELANKNSKTTLSQAISTNLEDGNVIAAVRILLSDDKSASIVFLSTTAGSGHTRWMRGSCPFGPTILRGVV